MNVLKQLLIIATTVLVLSCNEEDPTPQPVVATTYTNLEADTGTGRGDMGEVIGATGQFTFFSFADGDVVAHADSTTTKWDIGFRGTTIIINSGSSGPGSAGVVLLTQTFDEVTTAPEAGYEEDAEGDLAITTGSGNGWYTYVPEEFVIKPTPGRVLVVKTSDGRYAKMEILSYYKDAPASPNYMTDLDRHYTFRYVYQPNNTRSFE